MPEISILFRIYSEKRERALEAILKELLPHREPSFTIHEFTKTYAIKHGGTPKRNSIERIVEVLESRNLVSIARITDKKQKVFGLTDAGRTFVSEHYPDLIQNNESQQEININNQYTSHSMEALDTSRLEQGNIVMAEPISPPDSTLNEMVQQIDTSKDTNNPLSPDCVENGAIENSNVKTQKKAKIKPTSFFTDTRPSTDISTTKTTNNTLKMKADFAEYYSSVEAGNDTPSFNKREQALEEIYKELLLHKKPSVSVKEFYNAFSEKYAYRYNITSIYQLFKELYTDKYIYKVSAGFKRTILYGLTDEGLAYASERYPHLVQNNENNSGNRETIKDTPHSKENLDSSSSTPLTKTKVIEPEHDNNFGAEIIPPAQPAHIKDSPNSISENIPYKKRVSSSDILRPKTTKKANTTSNSIFWADNTSLNDSAQRFLQIATELRNKCLEASNSTLTNEEYSRLKSRFMNYNKP